MPNDSATTAQAPATAAPGTAAPAAQTTTATPPATPPVVPPTDNKAGAAADAGAATKDGQKTTQTVVPEKYDLKLPQGSLLDAETVANFTSFAKERGYSQEQAQAQLERESGVLTSYVEGEKAKLTQMQTKWIEELKADKDFGGAAFNENVELAKRTLTAHAPKEFLDWLEASGMGNNPWLIKTFASIGRKGANDKLVPAGGSASESRMEDRLYKPTPNA